MSVEEGSGVEILEAHQELVDHVEKSAARIRGLSIVTVAVAFLLAVSYIIQLSLPLFGTTSIPVNLADPANVAAELIVLFLTLVWLYVGVSDFRFSTKIRRDIAAARTKEREVVARVGS